MAIKILAIYLAGMSLVTFWMFGADKSRARKRRFRISERRLLIFALFGGSPGALAGMYVFRHKTRHRLFSVGIPLMLVLQMAAGACFYYLMVTM